MNTNNNATCHLSANLMFPKVTTYSIKEIKGVRGFMLSGEKNGGNKNLQQTLEGIPLPLRKKQRDTKNTR